MSLQVSSSCCFQHTRSLRTFRRVQYYPGTPYTRSTSHQWCLTRRCFYPPKQERLRYLINPGNQTVSLSIPTILDTHIRELNGNSYGPVVYLGPGNSFNYSLLISQETGDGTYFPLFTVSTTEAGSISYPFQFEVDSRNLSVMVVDKPVNFSLETTDNVTLSVANPRNGAVGDITITAGDTGADVFPSR